MDFGGLKVLMISTDRNILVPGSSVAERMKEYGKLVEELHIVLLSDDSHKLEGAALDKNVFVYPTNSSNKFLRPLDAVNMGRALVYGKKFVRGRALITAQDPFECGFVGARIKRKWRIPLEIQLHTDPFSPNFKGLLNTIRKQIAKKVLPQADGIRVVTNVLATKIGKRFNASNKISVLPIYIDTKKIDEGYVQFDLHDRFGWKVALLMVARLTAEKNFNLALKALKIVLESYPHVGLVIVGDGPDKDKILGESKKLGIDKNISLIGWQENLSPYYKTANIFLQTSFFEGYGLALVEAGLSSLPVVTTSVGVAEELVNGKEAFICTPTPEDFSEKILALINDESLAKRMGQSLKTALESKLLSKEEYMKKLKDSWEGASAKVSI